MGCLQCLSLSVVQLKGKHCRKTHCHNGVVDTFGQYYQKYPKIHNWFGWSAQLAKIFGILKKCHWLSVVRDLCYSHVKYTYFCFCKSKSTHYVFFENKHFRKFVFKWRQTDTGKSLSEALIFAHNMMTDCSLNYKLNTWKFQAQNWGEHVVYRNSFWHSEQFLYKTCSPHVLHKEELLTKIYLYHWTKWIIYVGMHRNNPKSIQSVWCGTRANKFDQ